MIKLIIDSNGFIVILNKTLTFRKCGEEGRQKCYSLGAAEYLAPTLLVNMLMNPRFHKMQGIPSQEGLCSMELVTYS
jgi:hypothetical protein